MTRIFASAKLISVAAALLLYLAASPALSQTEWDPNVSPLPTPSGPVNDYASVVDQATKERLDKRLIDYQRSTGVELAVAVVKTTGDRPIFDYSLAVARGWGIGSKGDDNPSALLFIAVDDRKYFTQVSRNLEDELPDGLVGSLQRQYLVPEFRNQSYAKGIEDTLEAYIRTIDQRSSGTAASPTPVARGERDGVSGGQAAYSSFCCLLIIFGILIIIFANRGGGGKGKGGWGGGGFGGGGSSVLPWIIGSAIGNAIGSSSSSSSSDWGSGWSGGGGGSDWGGFGGGGDFGGGGAGGDW
ncbi:MAG: TPM domain-containing protein [bacterium]|nr:TPM domain-containing protein [bacterium]